MCTSYGHYKQSQKCEYFMKTNYDIYIFGDFHNTSLDFLTKVRNALAKAIKEKMLLPKLVLIVLDNIMITFANHENFGILLKLRKFVNWLATEFHRMTLSYKEMLPHKSKRWDQPNFLWVSLPQNKNFSDNLFRMKFNKCLNDVIPLYGEMSIIYMKKDWDYYDASLFHKGKFTAKGLEIYWSSIDKSVQFWVTCKTKKVMKASTPQLSRHRQLPHSKFSWHKQFDNDKQIGNRKLPTPPPVD